MREPSLLTEFINRLTGKKSPRSGVVAIAALPEGLAIAYLRGESTATPELARCEFVPCGDAERPGALKSWVERNGLMGAKCRWVLDARDYRLMQTQRPEVPDAELREALRWRVQDMTDLPPEEAEIEYFPMPASRQGGRGETLSVVVCRAELVRAYSICCEQAGLDLRVIDIPQFGLRDLAERLPESARGLALIRLEENRGSVQVQQGDTLFITRELDFGTRSLGDEFMGDGDDGSPRDGSFDRLALEIQRSLDYYESHFGMPPVAGLIVAPIEGNTQSLVDRLHRSLGVIARTLDVTALLRCAGPLEDAIQQRCLTAVGAALGYEASRP
jgi:MSHA biogenesis protein MshI